MPNLETLAIHLGRQVDSATSAITPPIHLSTTFERQPDGSFPNQHIYIRDSNPNRSMLEACLAGLEGGVEAVSFASGSAAIVAVFQSLSTGDHAIIPTDIYRGTVRSLETVFTDWGLALSQVDMTDLSALKTAIRPNTKLVWVETPSNPLLKIVDIEAVADIAHQAGAICVCDSTWSTPVLLRPFEFGADLVVHATTKYMGGHSDVLGGVVIAKENNARSEKIRQLQKLGGAVQSPFDCWLIQRGLATLPYRMRAHSENAAKVAQFLQSHPQVAAVHYPGLKTHPGHAIAARQMRGFGGMLSIQIKGGEAEAMAVAAKVELITRATSLGGVESLIEHRASIEGAGTSTPDNLLRLSIGLEHPDDLIADLAQAMAGIVQ